MSVKDVLKFAADEKTAYVNVRFTDLVGAWTSSIQSAGKVIGSIHAALGIGLRGI